MDQPSPRSPLRSVGAVIAGVVAIVVLSTATDAVMHATGAFPPLGEPLGHGAAALALAYRCVYGVLGGYLTAHLAPGRPMKHALVLGVIGLALGTLGVAATWNGGPEFGPKWYSIALAVTALPCAWLGGRLCEGQRSSRAN